MTLKLLWWVTTALTTTTTAWAVEAASSSSSSTSSSLDDFGVFDWIHNAEGGYFNPKLEFRGKKDTDNGNAGLFAKERIEKDEVLLRVPWDLILHTTDNDDRDDDDIDVGANHCQAVQTLATELEKNDTSLYAPYMMYLHDKSISSSIIPSGWSDSGKTFLQHIVGGNKYNPMIPPVEPTEWLELDWYENCNGDPENDITSKAALFIVQRSDDRFLVPGWDLMVNHRNSGILDWYNTNVQAVEHVHVEVLAKRIIQAGEEIVTSYNLCASCGEDRQDEGYGTGEILRDYGVLEPFPQRWHYMNTDIQFWIDTDVDNKLQFWWDGEEFVPHDDVAKTVVWLQRQVRRLRRLRHIHYPSRPEDMPLQEWTMANEFLHANLLAMAMALQQLHVMENNNNNDMDQTCSAAVGRNNSSLTNLLCIPLDPQTNLLQSHHHHYDALDWEMDDLVYNYKTCDNLEIMKFADWTVKESIQTQYQTLNFAAKPQVDDICMDLDDVVQICSCYRPHYHEYSVHAAAKYLADVKRAIFIGGGDSMLLHEILKYPSLELVVGLELDQVVVRKSFKHFQTSPHFDDPRVEWWFGDATKSLLLLPEDYWGTFDLVLVDLSETVMSFPVTDELDVFDALALLLQPAGIMVKNEFYLEELSKVFDYTIQIFYESPIICSQGMIMGSHQVDFFRQPPHDHNVPALLYEGLHEPENKFDYMHDYRKKKRRLTKADGQCGDDAHDEEEEDDDDEQGRSAGILEIVEAEQCTVPLDETLMEKITNAITSNGFEILNPPVYEGLFWLILVEMKEGYVLARLRPEDNYVAFDIHLWGNFYKIKLLSQALSSVVGSSLVSNYRVVVGGMYGCSTWKQDQQIVGPKTASKNNQQTCGYDDENKNNPVIPATGSMSVSDLVEVMFLESLNLIQVTDHDVTAVVLCGNAAADDDCQAESLLRKSGKFSRVHKLLSCSNLESKDMDAETRVTTMYECEKSQMKDMDDMLGEVPLDLFVFDRSVPYEMFQIWNSILDSDELQQSYTNGRNIILAWSENPSDEPWKQQFLERYRKQYHYDPVTRALFVLESNDAFVEFGLVATEDELIAYHLEEVEQNVRNKNVDVELVAMQGGLFPYSYVYDPITFQQSDYDNKPGLMQFSEQKPFGRQALFQLEPKQNHSDDEDDEPPVEKVKFVLNDIQSALEATMESLEIKNLSRHHVVKDIGDGALFVFLGNSIQVVVVWDGQHHVDVNLYMDYSHGVDKTNQAFDKVIGTILKKLYPTMIVALRDDMPRGIGRVINLMDDIQS